MSPLIPHLWVMTGSLRLPDWPPPPAPRSLECWWLSVGFESVDSFTEDEIPVCTTLGRHSVGLIRRGFSGSGQPCSFCVTWRRYSEDKQGREGGKVKGHVRWFRFSL
ncbi:hypothetical protein E2C01_031332 [Portunus trituberculatus]|uniref:Uncharacterized protein n=1 Tax=Portunus trituberculatus TaxID=210409 RepID=A0A5B7EXD8_PORTR|nr:hypothetical protein [Portunus trituberculatus]